jgi:hypothetical protein
MHHRTTRNGQTTIKKEERDGRTGELLSLEIDGEPQPVSGRLTD